MIISRNHMLNKKKSLTKSIKHTPQETTLEIMSKATSSAIDIKGLKLSLRDFQKAGIDFIEKTKGRTLIGDPMGLGKTIQSLAWVYHRNIYPALVICPAHLKYNWQQEIRLWFSDNIDSFVIESTFKQIEIADITIINYEILHKFLPILKDQFKAIIIDEVHFIANKSKRTTAVKNICKNVKHVLGLSGTPFLNKPMELYNILQILRPDIYSNFFKYAKRYCDAKQGRFGYDTSGSSNKKELSKLLRQTVLLRREKKDVLKQLPEKNRILIQLHVDNMKTYDAINNDKYIAKLVKIGILKREAARLKLKLFTKWVENFLESSDEKLIVFAHHIEYIDSLKKDLKKYKPLSITGANTSKEKQDTVNLFQQNKDKNRLIICSIRAAYSGYTLTMASNVAFLEFDWNHQIHQQCEDRAHRIGQHNTVTCYYFMVIDTIEEYIYKILMSKLAVFKEIFSDRYDTNTSIQSVKKELLKYVS